MASRSLEDLDPKVQPHAHAFIDGCKARGVDLLVTCTYRSGEEQNALYAIGRTQPGHKVTNAKAGQSFHQYRVALDVVPMVHGKPDWSGTSEAWKIAGEEGLKAGFEWGAKWLSFPEKPHFQMTFGHSLSYYQSGGRP